MFYSKKNSRLFILILGFIYFTNGYALHINAPQLETTAEKAGIPTYKTIKNDNALPRERSDTDNHVAIVGAGLGGTTMALHLLRQGFKVTLIDKGASRRPGGMSISLEEGTEHLMPLLEKASTSEKKFLYLPKQQLASLPVSWAHEIAFNQLANEAKENKYPLTFLKHQVDEDKDGNLVLNGFNKKNKPRTINLADRFSYIVDARGSAAARSNPGKYLTEPTGYHYAYQEYFDPAIGAYLTSKPYKTATQAAAAAKGDAIHQVTLKQSADAYREPVRQQLIAKYKTTKQLSNAADGQGISFQDKFSINTKPLHIDPTTGVVKLSVADSAIQLPVRSQRGGHFAIVTAKFYADQLALIHRNRLAIKASPGIPPDVANRMLSYFTPRVSAQLLFGVSKQMLEAIPSDVNLRTVNQITRNLNPLLDVHKSGMAGLQTAVSEKAMEENSQEMSRGLDQFWSNVRSIR